MAKGCLLTPLPFKGLNTRTKRATVAYTCPCRSSGLVGWKAVQFISSLHSSAIRRQYSSCWRYVMSLYETKRRQIEQEASLVAIPSVRRASLAEQDGIEMAGLSTSLAVVVWLRSRDGRRQWHLQPVAASLLLRYMYTVGAVKSSSKSTWVEVEVGTQIST